MDEFEAKIAALELLILQRTSRSISDLETTLSMLESAKIRSDELNQRLNNLNSSYPLLVEWSKGSLKGRKAYSHTLERVYKFHDICRRVSRLRSED